MSKKLSILLALLLVVCCALPACSGGQSTQSTQSSSPSPASQSSTQAVQPAEAKEKEVTIVYHFTSNTMDPALDARNLPVRSGSHETLTKIADGSMDITPWLAESWSSEDGVNWTFTIRSGVKFQDGTACDAAAVKASLERAISLSASVKSALYIESIEADGQTLTIVTSEPHPTLPSDLAFPLAAITKVDAPDIENKPIGTGPYKITDFTANAEIVLEKNDEYWNGDPKLDKVVILMNEDANARLLALQAGDVDILMKPSLQSLAALEGDSNYVVDTTVGVRDHLVMYNTTHRYLDNASFRKGMDCLIDRDTIVKSVMMNQATAAYGPFSEVFDFAPAYEKRAFGLENALVYFEEAGLTVKDGKVTDNGTPIVLTFTTYTSQDVFNPISQMIQSNAKQLGIELNIQIIEKPDDWLPANSDTWDMSLFSLPAVPRGDAANYLNSSIATNATRNYGKISNAEIDALINEFNVTSDVAQRNELAKAAAKIVDEECYNSYIVYPNITSVYRNTVKGFVTSGTEYYMVDANLDIDV